MSQLGVALTGNGVPSRVHITKTDMSSILERIVSSKRAELRHRRELVPAEELKRRLSTAPPVRDFRAALENGPGLRIIAEVKKASPSAGVLRADFDPVAIARIYAENGRRCH